MITVLLGHRGVGKSSLLGRVQEYEPNAICIDLDEAIEKVEQKPIGDFFRSVGEEAFRIREKDVFQQLIEDHRNRDQKIFLALGAGFQGEIPSFVSTLWIRRPTDNEGRVFTHRPPLEANTSGIEEWRIRFPLREERYRQLASETLTLREGDIEANDPERFFFTNQIEKIGGCLTLLPENFSSKKQWKSFIDRRLQWGIDAFELRDDLLDPTQMEMALEAIPMSQIIFSFRNQNLDRRTISERLSKGCRIDWDINLGPYPKVDRKILSVHSRLPGERITDILGRLESIADGHTLLKAAPVIEDFTELRAGHLWAAADHTRRTFLPRSQDGRFSWYRLYVKGNSSINFWREGHGSALDQPTLLEWIGEKSSIDGTKTFAAVLGDPVRHSFTPIEQRSFFRKRNLSTYSIQLSENHWKNGALEVLQELGLRYAAVTSPLKQGAYQACKNVSELTAKLESVNTMYFDGHRSWHGENTDLAGLRKAWKSLPNEVTCLSPIVIWGGGGTFPIVKELFPKAVFYSARSGQPRDGETGCTSPQLVLWAAGSRGQFPPESWQPGAIVDLSYHQNSPALEYARQTGAKYISGLSMYRSQAKEQRKFWEICERE